MKRIVLYFGCTVIGAFTAIAAGADHSAADQSFVDDAARGGKMEVELGQLAQKKGSNAEVKEFGALMVKDHTKLNDELGAAAKSSGLTVPTELKPDQKTEYRSLSQAFGKNFDKRYADLMVKDHTNDLEAFRKADTTTKNAELKKAIDGAIPVVEHHLQMAKSMATKANGS